MSKQYTRDELRRPARIASIFRGVEEHGIHTVTVHLEGVSGGWGQGFGCLCLKDDDEIKQFIRELCEAAGVADAERLIGLACLALYSKSPWDIVEGVEFANGRRFTIKGYRRRHYPDNAPTPTEAERKSLRSDIVFHERRAAEQRAALDALGTLIDWDVDP